MPKPAGTTIRSLRQKCGYKTGQFAKLVGISRQHMTNIESGYAGASVELMNRIAVALSVEVTAIEASEVTT